MNKDHQNDFEKRYDTLISSPLDQISLSECRDVIDSIDNELLSFLEKRLEVVKRVGEIKRRDQDADTHRKSFIRPGREARLIREILSKSSSQYAPRFLMTIWRHILSASVNYETPLSCGVLSQEEKYAWQAREAYGAFIPIHSYDSVKTLCDAIVSQDVIVGLCPYDMSDTPWWVTLKPYAKDKQLSVFTQHPFVSDPNSNQFVSIAHIDPEPSGDDRSLWVVALDDIAQKDVFLEAMSHTEVNAVLCDEDGVDFLIDVEGFYCDENHELIHQLRHNCTHITDITILGAYAKLFQIEEGAR